MSDRRNATGGGLGTGPQGLTENQKRWADAKRAGRTDREAYKLAGYAGQTEAGIQTSISRLRNNKRIQAYVESFEADLERPDTDAGWLERYLVLLEKDFTAGSSKDRRDAIALHAELKGLRVKRIEDLTQRKRSNAELIEEAREFLGDEVVAPLCRKLGVEIGPEEVKS